MAERPPKSQPPPAYRPVFFSGSELEARRRARRRQVRRRRAGALLAVGVIAAVVVAVVLGQRGGARSQNQTVAGVGHPRPLARTHKPVVDHHRSFTTLTTGAINRVLAYTPYITVGRPRRREVALTFDDGPGPYTLRILTVLQRAHVHATFFEVGRWVNLYPSVTRRLAEAGEVIGDHTEDHPPLAELAADQQRDEVVNDARAITHAGAPAPHLFRPPYGSFNQTTLAMLRAEKLLMVLWTVDTSDYARPGVERITFVALSGARPGAIILMHDGGGDRSETVAALPRIIQRLRQRGYQLVTVPHLVRDDPPRRGQPAPQPLSGAI
ncbi:MAG: polysaccharide deacetylase family protein [Solirubrobacteraceae bacterium]